MIASVQSLHAKRWIPETFGAVILRILQRLLSKGGSDLRNGATLPHIRHVILHICFEAGHSDRSLKGISGVDYSGPTRSIWRGLAEGRDILPKERMRVNATN